MPTPTFSLFGKIFWLFWADTDLVFITYLLKSVSKLTKQLRNTESGYHVNAAIIACRRGRVTGIVYMHRLAFGPDVIPYAKISLTDIASQ